MTAVSMLVWNEFTNDARVLKEAQTLQKAGYVLTIHALHTPGVTEHVEELAGGIRVKRISRSPLWRLRNRKSFQRQGSASSKNHSIPVTPLRQGLRILARLWTHFGLLLSIVKARPGVIHAHDVNVLPTAWVASIICRIPLVYDAHEISTDREGYVNFRKIVGCVEKFIMPRAAGCITTTDARSKFFARAYGIDRPLVLQNRPRYTSVERNSTIRDCLKLTKSWPVVLYQGGLQQGRGLEKFVRLASEIPNAYFVLIGGGRLTSHLLSVVEDCKLNERVFFIPTITLNELPKFTASADIGVQPIENTCLNHFTTDSNKLFEYVIAGLPVVASHLPEIAKVVQEFKLGLLASPEGKEELRDAIIKLVDDESLRKKFSENAYKAALKLNWEVQEGELVKLYNKVVAAEIL
ncbi:glycosyltransferase family 4 protein [Microbulbifer salipaludis]|uniref:Glycosyltransferase family 4 protein n=1 Tax=Microbulbifer salipaludis TaxID=187980 RepID=A0ABS3E927_9GAMM|nr:glycosyltransferase family 4 protein [Microbulbifer salipaludis]MBN8431784.1 glycosyltransferase family 4 protein [Microbulbifer salipaludis]